MDKEKVLFDHFPPVTTQEWMDKITADLKGADFHRRLVWKTDEGFDVMPFYRKENLADLKFTADMIKLRQAGTRSDGATIQSPGIINNSWLIRQDVYVYGYEEANREALDLLSKGIDSVGFVISDPESVTETDFDILLRGLETDRTELNFISAGNAREILSCLIGNTYKKGLDPTVLNGCIETDPLGRLMVNGTLCIPPGQGFDYLAALARDAEPVPGLRIVQVNGTNFVNSGADTVQELALSIAAGVEYLHQLTERGISAGKAASRIRFSFGTGSDYFMEIAKLRAARILWSLVRDGYEADNDSFRMEIHCMTASWNTTVYDPYVNMLRTQTEAMSSVLGGTDSLTVNPFDMAFSVPGEFSRRIARNQQLILREEACLDKVADPASGSYYIENLTSLIAEHAWGLFLETERRGGFLESLKNGSVQKLIKESARKRMIDVSKRKKALLGTNIYADPEEGISSEKLRSIKFSEPARGTDLIVEPVTAFRASEPFERIRNAVNRASKRPAIFLFPVGDRTMRRIRAQFSSGFFGCAGYRIIGNDGFATVDEGVTMALASKADIVVICSSDAEYVQFAPAIKEMLKDEVITVIAGNPPDMDQLKALGLVHYISAGTDAIETLNYFNSLLGIN